MLSRVSRDNIVKEVVTMVTSAQLSHISSTDDDYAKQGCVWRSRVLGTEVSTDATARVAGSKFFEILRFWL